MPYPLPLTRTEAYLAYKAGVIQQSDLKPSLAVPRNGIDAWLAYWTGLAADYPKREDGTPHILQEEEAYIAYLCGVINEYPEKCLRRVGAYLRYIISARWGRPDHPLNREELYLSLIKTQFIPSGDPSSDITIDGTTKAQFVDVKMYGDTFQQSYEGWNILDVDFENTTSAGVTKTLNADKTITLNGKINAGLNFTFGKDITFDTSSQYTLKVEVLRGSCTPYTNDGQASHQWAVLVNMGLSSLGWQSYAVMCADDVTTVTFTPAQETGTPRFWFGYNASTSDETTGIFNDYTLRISVKKGTTISGYEPFVGGISSPNPTYPQVVKTVTGRQVVRVTGKNIFDKTAAITNLYNGPSAVATSLSAKSVIIKCSPNTTYTYTNPDGELIKSDSSIGFYPSEPVVGLAKTGANANIKNNTSMTFTTPENTEYMLLYFAWGSDGSEEAIQNIQIELGSTATAYTPYIFNNYEINLGKNLFDKDNAVIYNAYIWTTEFVLLDSYQDRTFLIPCLPNTTYTISRSIKTSSFRASYLDSDVVIPAPGSEPSTAATYTCGQYVVNNNGTSITITTGENANRLIVHYGHVGNDANINESLATIQVEVGDSATPYAPYFTPIELCKLGDYQDYIWKDQNQWKIHKETGQVSLNGTEDWYASQSAIKVLWVDTPDRSGLGVSDIYRGYPRDAVNGDVYMNCAVRQTVGGLLSGAKYGFGVRTEAGGGALTNASNALYVRFDGYTTVDAVKQYFSSRNAILYYQLNEATDTAITDTNLIAQLNALVNGGAEDGTTYIKVSASDPNLPALLTVEAPKYE